MRYADLPDKVNLATYFLDQSEPSRTALITEQGTLTYAELSELANRFGNAFTSLGVRRGDRVLIAMQDGVEFVAAWYGAQRIGAVTAEVFSYLHASEYRYYLDYIAPAAVVADATTAPAVGAAGARNMLVSGVAGTSAVGSEYELSSLLDAQPTELDSTWIGKDDVAMLKFTSGSTGEPKACLVPARSPILSFDWYAREVLDIRPDDVLLPVSKLFFAYARDLVAMYSFGVGAAGVIFPERSTPQRVFELIETYRPTILVNVPTMMKSMFDHPDAGSYDLSSIRLCISAGESLPADLHDAWTHKFGVEIVEAIGSCESYHAYLSNRPGNSRAGSVGQVVPGYSVRLLDENGDPVPVGSVGVLELVGEPVADGYLQNSERSASTFPAKYTLRTNDRFVRDDDGFYYHQGRTDQLLKVGGVWASPMEIETCLQGHPQVRDCAVVGYEDAGLTRTRAFVVAAGPVSAKEIQDFARARLSPHKYPRDVRFVDALPRTSSDKIDRNALTESSVVDGVIEPAIESPDNLSQPHRSLAI